MGKAGAPARGELMAALADLPPEASVPWRLRPS
jgi:hypothetical protein